LGCGAIILRDDQVLLIQRRRAPEVGHWGLPGGKVDWLEPVEETVRREIREELDIGLGDLELLCVVDQIDAEAETHWVAPVYIALSHRGEPRLMEPEKHAAYGWFPLDAPPAPLTVATVVALSTMRSQGQRSR
jgi:ADP-ribose pyrophosphatase YjhB (NUDIX family)